MYTLTYTAPGADASTAVTQSFPDWGIGQEWRVTFREQEADEMVMTMPASAVAANPFQFRGTCVVKDDDGDVIFQGVLTTDPRSAEVPREAIELTWSGPWWYLAGLPYEQLYPQSYGPQGQILTYQFLTHFVLNRSYDNEGFAFSCAMISAILDFAIYKGVPIQYEATASPNTYFPRKPDGSAAFLGNFPDLPVLPEVVVNISTAQALLRQIEDYDCVMYFDHSTTPPTFRVKHRGDADPAFALTAVTRRCSPINNQLSPINDVIGFAIKERYDLRVPFVQITYEQTLTVQGQSLLTSIVDLYPNPRPAAPNSFYPLAVTIPLPSISSSIQAAVVGTTAVIGPNGPTPGTPSGPAPAPDYGPAEDLDFWKAVKPELNDAAEFANLAIVPGSSTRQTNLPNVITLGSHCAWMGGKVQKETFTCQFTYTTRNTTQVAAHTFSVTKTATDINAPNGATFTSTSGSNPGEDAGSYAGMARLIYTDLNARQWEGTIPIYDEVWTGGIAPGDALNIANAFPDWAAMNAPVREVTWQFGIGLSSLSTNNSQPSTGVRGQIKIGPNKKLTPTMIMDRMKAWRLKFAQLVSFSSVMTGSVAGGPVTMPDSTDATTPGHTPPNLLAQVIGNGTHSVNPGEAAVIHSPGIPNPPLPQVNTPIVGGFGGKSGLIQRDVAPPPSNEDAGVWAIAQHISSVSSQGYANPGLLIAKVDVNGNPAQITATGPNIGLNGAPSYSDASGNPTGAIGGQILLDLAHAFGCNLSLRGVTGCDANGNKLYMLVLGSVWSQNPIPGITYDAVSIVPA